MAPRFHDGVMGRRRASYPFTIAASEIAFAVAAFACGLYDAPLWLTALAALGMLAYWSWTRRVLLNRMRGAAWATATIMGVVTIISIIAGAYWLGLVSGGLI
jgi:hypothetical protein